LAYGVSSAPAIFQSVVDQSLSGLTNVVCRIEDILITAPDDEAHFENTPGGVFSDWISTT
jgi:hypothetical protein